MPPQPWPSAHLSAPAPSGCQGRIALVGEGQGGRSGLGGQACSQLHPYCLLCAPCPQLAQKYDHQREQELREWIEGVTGRRIGNNFMDGLKDGIILCE